MSFGEYRYAVRCSEIFLPKKARSKVRIQYYPHLGSTLDPIGEIGEKVKNIVCSEGFISLKNSLKAESIK